MNEARAAPGARVATHRLIRPVLCSGAVLLVVALAFLGYKARQLSAARSSARSVRELIQAGQFEEAGEPLSRWLELTPDSAEARFFAGRRAIGLHRFDVGIAELEAARKLGYSPQAIERERGILLAWMGRLSEAEPILRKLFLAGSRDRDLDQALAKCYIENFQLRAAEEVVKRWIADAPADASAYFWSAELKRRKTDVELPALIRDYEHVLELDTHYDKARIVLAELYLKVHRNADAENAYATYLQRHPGDVEACLGLGQIAAEYGREDEAIELLDRAIKLAPKDFRALVERAKIESRRGRFAVALEFLDKAVKVDTVEPEIRYQRSIILSRLGRTADARQEQEEMSRLRKGKEDFDKLREGLLKFPADTQRQIQAARWFFEHGHPEEGVRWAEKILREHSHHAGANWLLADHYQKQGNPGLANFYRLQASGP